MSISIVDIQLEVRTAEDSATFSAAFKPGLNVIEAPNSWGKSTLVQSIVYGLGLEGSFSTSHLSPLGEAMSSSIVLKGQRQAIVESWVVLTLRNERGEYLRTKRWATSLARERNLVETWSTDSLDGLSDAKQIDTYVREPGGATKSLGFHTLLANFVGWDLPDVPTFTGQETRLYLELLFPLFYVEQKYGWSGLAPRVPTHFGIRSPFRRAAEYVLGLESLNRAKIIESTRVKLSGAREASKNLQTSLDATLRRTGWRLTSEVVAGSSDLLEGIPTVQEQWDGTWIGVEEAEQRLSTELSQLRDSPTVDAATNNAVAQASLRQAQAQLTALSSQHTLISERLARSRADLGAIESRLSSVAADRERLIQLAKLERLGSELHIHSLEHASCPTCAQSLDAQRVASGVAMSVNDNLAMLAAEKKSLQRIQDSETVSVSELEAEGLRNLEIQSAVRGTIRSLKDELGGPSASASISQVRRLVRLEDAIASHSQSRNLVSSLVDDLATLLEEVAKLESTLRQYTKSDADSRDLIVIRRLTEHFRAALRAFGFSSISPDELTIGKNSLLPEHDGFELTFDINHGLSASDSIRVKWAYYSALAKTSNEYAQAQHLGILVLDEPRQQEAKPESVFSLYRDLASVASNIQVIVASSAARADLDIALSGVVANRIQSQTAHLLE